MKSPIGLFFRDINAWAVSTDWMVNPDFLRLAGNKTGIWNVHLLCSPQSASGWLDWFWARKTDSITKVLNCIQRTFRNLVLHCPFASRRLHLKRIMFSVQHMPGIKCAVKSSLMNYSREFIRKFLVWEICVSNFPNSNRSPGDVSRSDFDNSFSLQMVIAQF